MCTFCALRKGLHTSARSSALICNDDRHLWLVWWLERLSRSPPKNTHVHTQGHLEKRGKKSSTFQFLLCLFLFVSPSQFISLSVTVAFVKKNKLSSIGRHLWSITDCIAPLMVLGYSGTGEEPVVVGGDGLGAWSACGLTMTWITKSFWILVSCSRVLSVSSFPEKNQRWWTASMSSWTCSCFFSWPMVSTMLTLRRKSFPVDSRTYRGAESRRVS